MKVTSRERPKQLLETVKSYIEMAANTSDMVWLFSFDSNDESYNTDEFITKLVKESNIKTESNVILCGGESFKFYDYDNGAIVFGESTGKINAVNRDVNSVKTNWDILFCISDDQRPIVKGYDNIIRNAMPDNLDASLWFTDTQPRINTQEILGYNYYKRFNYIYHPDYMSLFCDNEATEVAKILGKQIKSNKQIVSHLHYAWGHPNSFKKDSLYERNDKFWKQDETTFHARRKINFGL